jgi:hypothetical protein
MPCTAPQIRGELRTLVLDQLGHIDEMGEVWFQLKVRELREIGEENLPHLPQFPDTSG